MCYTNTVVLCIFKTHNSLVSILPTVVLSIIAHVLASATLKSNLWPWAFYTCVYRAIRRDTYNTPTISLSSRHTHKFPSSAVECVCRCLGSGLLAPSARRALVSQTGAVESSRLFQFTYLRTAPSTASLACVVELKRKNVSTQMEKRVYP